MKFYILMRLYILLPMSALLWAMGMPDLALYVPLSVLAFEWFVYGLFALCLYCD